MAKPAPTPTPTEPAATTETPAPASVTAAAGSTTDQTSVRVLKTGDTSAADEHSTDDGWEVQDVGRVRGFGLAKTVADAALGIATDGDDERGDDPEQLNGGLKPERPSDLKDHADETDEAETGEVAAKVDEPEPPKRSLDGRIKAKRAELGRISAELRAARAEADRLRRPAVPATPRDERGQFATREPRTSADAPVVPEKPVWKAFDEAGKSWDDFVEAQDVYVEAKVARQAWDLEQRVNSRVAQIEKSVKDGQRVSAEEKVTTTFVARRDEFKRTHPDFDTVIEALDGPEFSDQHTTFLHDVATLHERGPEILYELGKRPDDAAALVAYDWTQTMFDAVMASSNPSAMLLHFASNEADFERIVQMPPPKALLALGALDARLSTPADTRAHGSRTAVPVSKAPAPIRPMGGSRGTATPPKTPYDVEFGPEYVSGVNRAQRERGAY